MDDAERIRRDFAAAWGRFGVAWGVAPSTATVHGYMLLHGGPLTEAQLREALGFSHRATLLALSQSESWGLIERTEPIRTGRRGPPSQAWVQVGDHWRWFGRVAGARKERETDPVMPLLEECRRRAKKVDSGDLRQRLDSLVKFIDEFDRGIGVIVRAHPEALAHLFGVLGRMEPATVDRLIEALAKVPEAELARAGATLAGMRPELLRGFIGLASQRGIARLLRGRG
ncbi:MAG: GbsR/MarR family transcriptional regulator [Candidatus Limnocylindria bacterium]